MGEFVPHELLTKKETIKRLKISRAKYEYFIESGILPKPFEIAPGSRLYHSPLHLEAVEKNIYERAIAGLKPKTPNARPIKSIAQSVAKIYAHRNK